MRGGKGKTAPLIITGMHRSGTSLAASILQKCGLHVGERLYPADHGNVLGHFENIDFIKFHEDILEAQGFSNIGWAPRLKINVPAQFHDRAGELIDRNAMPGMWGWKDPRTTLFLDFWADFLVDVNYLFIFRSPWEVVDSLYRRGDKTFRSNPNFAVEMWVNHNKAILDFKMRHPDRSLVVSIDAIAHAPEAVVSALNERFNLSLTAPAHDVFDGSLLRRSASTNYRRALIEELFPESIAIFQDLEIMSLAVDSIHDSGWTTCGNLANNRDWALQDWLDARTHELELRWANQHSENLSSQLLVAHERLNEGAAEMEQINQRSLASEAVIAELRQEADVLKDRLASADAETARLSLVQSELGATLTQLESARFQVHEEALRSEQLRDEVTLAHTNTEQVRSDLAVAQARAEQLQSDLTVANSEINLLGQEIDLGRERLRAAETEGAQLRTELETARESLETCNSNNEDLKLELSAVQTRLRASGIDNERLKYDLSAGRGKLAAAEADIEHLEYELRIAKDRLAAAQSTEKRLRALLQESRNAISAVERTRIWQLRDHYIKLRQRVESLTLTGMVSWLSKQRWWAFN